MSISNLKSRLLYVLAGLCILSGLGLMGRSLYRIYTRKNLVSHDGQVSAELKRVRNLDYETLTTKDTSGDQDVDQIATSLLRYTSQNLPESETIIKKYIGSRNLKVQAAALEASGAYEWADLKLFSDALQSPDELMRLSALRGLGKRSSSERIRTVESYSRKMGLSDKEWLDSRLTLIRINSNPIARTAYQVEVLSKLKSFSDELQKQALIGLLRAYRADAKMLEVAKAELMNPNSKIALNAIQYLSAYDNKWLIENFASLPNHQDHTYQMMCIDLMVKSCPKGWQKIRDQIRGKPAGADIPKHLDEAELTLKCLF